jgi:16S rRNA (guanine1207-N2)-methyltransferase
MSNTSHYFTKELSSTKRVLEHDFQTILFDQKFMFTTVDGLFSKDEVDYGSRVLLKYANLKDGQTVLDLGCGYGPVGIIVAKRFSKSKVVCSDVTDRALIYTQKNAEKNNVRIITILSDGFENIPSEFKFDVILFNPPFSAGKKVCMKLISDAKSVLSEHGTLQIVAPRKKGGESLANYMQEVYGNLEVLGKSGGFWVYSSRREDYVN